MQIFSNHQTSTSKKVSIFNRLSKSLSLALLFLLIEIATVNAQCTWLTDYYVDLVPIASNSSAPQPGCAPLACDELMYEVVLKKQSTVSSNQFKYNYFAILGNIQMNISNGDYVDVARSVQCSPSWNAAELNIQSTGEVAFLLGDQSQGGEPLAGQSITFVNGSALLFRVIVHTSPGSQISWQNPTPNPVNPYLWVYGKNTGNSLPNCMGVLTVTYGGAASPKMQAPTQASCGGGLTYSFGTTPAVQNIPQGSTGTYYWIPVMLEGQTTPTVFEEIQMVIEIKTNTYMEYGNVAGNLINCVNLLQSPCDISVSNSESGGFFYRTIRAQSFNVAYNPANPMFLQAAIFGPLNQSLGGIAEISVKYIKLKQNGTCCLLAPKTTDKVTLNFAGLPVCPEYQWKVTNGTATPGSCEVVQDIQFTWDSPLNTIFFDKLELKIAFFTTMPVTEIRNSAICPTGSCITYAQGASNNVYEVTCLINNQTLTKNAASFSVVFSDTDGCIDGFHIKKSEVNDVFAMTSCAPKLTPPYTTPGQFTPQCISRIAGNVTYHFKSCDNFLITASPSNDPGGTCTRTAPLFDESQSFFGLCVCRDKYPYTVSCKAQDNNDPLCGVTTYDLVLISRRILGLEILPDALVIAGDANCSGTLTSFDIVELRKLILGIYEELPNDIPSFKIFSDPININNGWPASEFCKPEDDRIAYSATNSANFQVVKTGDVNKSCEKGGVSCFAGALDDRTDKKMQIFFGRLPMNKGGLYQIPIIAEQDIEAAALQFELKFDPEALILKSTLVAEVPEITAEHFGLAHAKDGFCRLAWSTLSGESIQIKAGTVLAYLEVEALTDLPNAGFDIVYRNIGIQPVAYSLDGTEWEMITRENVTLSTSPNKLSAQVVPNPSATNSTLIIASPVETTATIRITNQIGNTIALMKQDLFAGTNTILLDASTGTLAEGLYFIEINANNTTQALRMIRF